MTATIRHRRFAILFRAAGAILVVLAAAAPHPARAAVGEWTTNGPYGGVILALAADPSNSSTVYAATPKRVYKSIDAGIRWAPFGHFGFIDILLPTSDPSTFYAAGVAQYVLRRTSDGGASWVERPIPGTGSETLTDLTVDPANPTTLYAIVLRQGTTHLYRSTDGADSWQPLSGPAARMTHLVVDPNDSRALYVANYERTHGVYRSADGGATWIRTRLDEAVYKLVHGKESRLYAFAITGIQVTTDGGSSWTRIFPGLTNALDLAIDPTDFRRVYLLVSGGVYTSEDGGRTVHRLDGLGGGLRAIVVPERFVVLVGTQRGVLRNMDPFEPWEKSDYGISEFMIGSIAVDPTDPRIVVAGTEAGIAESGNGGKSWSDPRPGSPVSTSRIAIDPSDPSTRYAASGFGLHKSTDGGATWQRRDPAGVAGRVADLVIDPDNPRRILASYGNTLYSSRDGATTWSSVFREEYSASYYYPPEVTAIAIAPSDTATVYAGSSTEAGTFLYRSLDGGDNWSNLGATPSLGTLAVDACDPRIVQASSSHATMFRSLDGGHTWEGSFVAEGANLLSELVRDPRHSSSYFVGTSNGVYSTSDRGASWTRFEPGLNEPVYSLALDASGRFLHAGTGAGVYTFERNFEPCRDGAGRLCLIGKKFELSVTARKLGIGPVVSGHAISEGDQFGYFSFPELTGDASVPEVFVKMIDASAAPPPYGGHIWVFHSSLTDLDYTLVVRETDTGRTRRYVSQRTSSLTCGVADTTGFERSCEPEASSSIPGGGTTLRAGSGGELSLLGGRFRATVRARDPRSGRTAEGAAIARADGFGYFSLPAFTNDSSFPEVFVKMVDARSQPSSAFWVFHTGLTDLEYTLEITDGVTGSVRSYVRRASGTSLCGQADTRAFPD